jgi:hypothetical protein
LLWLDSDDEPSKDFLQTIPHYIPLHGFCLSRSSADIGTWTHQGLFDYYGVEKAQYEKFMNCNGAIIGFDTNDATIVGIIMTA